MKERFHISKYVNFGLLAVVLLLLTYGTIMVNSATSGMSSDGGMLKRQLFGIGVGLIALVFMWVFDYRKLKDYIVPLFVANAILIISPRIPGLSYTAKGMTGWLAIGPYRLFQPSEPAKLVTILLIAALVGRYHGKIESFSDFMKVFGMTLVPAALVMLIPDLGTALVFIMIAFGILLVGGARAKYLIVVFALGLTAAVGLVAFDVNYATKNNPETGDGLFLKRYQLNRLVVFVDPTRDPQGAGYNLNQSKIAIGSGELTGQGLGSGTQGNLNFLPERHTDFIFAVLGEELGFTGTIVLLGLYLALLVVALNIAVSSSDLYGTLAVIGVMSMWTFQILENAGMTMGLMPITGIPLPFMSYGSSFMVTNLACVGLLLSVWSRRPYQGSKLRGV